MKRTVKDIEKEMTELWGKKELAYIDMMDNAGGGCEVDHLRDEFTAYKNKWNELVKERKQLLKTR